MNRLPVTGSNQLLDLLDPYIPDDFINHHCRLRPVRGPRWQFNPAQLWRTHLLPLLTPVRSLNLLVQLLPEQRAWRDFARLRNRHVTPDVRILNAFRACAGVCGLRQINEVILQPLIQTAALWQNATALIDATDLPAACSGFKKKTLALTPLIAPRWADARSRPGRAVGSSATKSTAFACGEVAPHGVAHEVLGGVLALALAEPAVPGGKAPAVVHPEMSLGDREGRQLGVGRGW